MNMAAAGEAESAEGVRMMRQMDSDDKVSSKKKYIHDDLSFYILSKLPIKSLKRFRCVRKSWSILFENSHFMAMYRNHFISCNNDDDCTFLLLYVREMDNRYHAQLHLFPSTDQTFKNTLKLNLPPPFHDDDYLQILGSTSVNGILCIKQNTVGNDPHKVRFVLWNPATHELVVVPPGPDESVPRIPNMYCNLYDFHGFGYDKVRDDFKVFQYVRFDVRDTALLYEWPPISRDAVFEIYSLRTNSWRIVDIDVPYSFIFTAHQGPHGVYLDGMCHWLVHPWNVSLAGSEKCLLSFDLSDEVFSLTPMDEKHFFEEPMDENSDYSFYTRYHLVVLNESIAVITNHDTTLQISILGELGVKESWIKLFIIGLTPSFDWRPIGVGKKGYIFFRKKDDELAWVDLRTQQIEEIGVKAEECCCVIGIYKESLLPIVGLNN